MFQRIFFDVIVFLGLAASIVILLYQTVTLKKTILTIKSNAESDEAADKAFRRRMLKWLVWQLIPAKITELACYLDWVFRKDLLPYFFVPLYAFGVPLALVLLFYITGTAKKCGISMVDNTYRMGCAPAIGAGFFLGCSLGHAVYTIATFLL